MASLNRINESCKRTAWRKLQVADLSTLRVKKIPIIVNFPLHVDKTATFSVEFLLHQIFVEEHASHKKFAMSITDEENIFSIWHTFHKKKRVAEIPPRKN